MSRTTGRRRRVLQEEIRATAESTLGLAYTGRVALEPGDTPRYGAQANIENHPQVTDLVPRRFATIVLLLSAPLAIAAGVEVVCWKASVTEAWLGSTTLAQAIVDASVRLGQWFSAGVLALAALAALQVYSLKRYRIDDFKGRYRVWRFAALLGLVVSANCVVGLHNVLSQLGDGLVANAYISGALWWLPLVALAGGWALLRLVVNSSECFSTCSAFVVAAVCFVVGAVSALGWSPAALDAFPGLLSRVAPAVGYTLILAGCITYARYIVLDVQGLIAHRETQNRDPDEEQKPQPVKQTAVPTPKTPQQEKTTFAATTPSQSEWVDGSEREKPQNTGPRKLTKAERKRLRKLQQARNKAA